MVAEKEKPMKYTGLDPAPPDPDELTPERHPPKFSADFSADFSVPPIGEQKEPTQPPKI